MVSSNTTYVCTVYVNADSLDGHSTHSQTLATKPITMLDFVEVAIQREEVVKRILNDKFGEHTNTTANCSTAKVTGQIS